MVASPGSQAYETNARITRDLNGAYVVVQILDDGRVNQAIFTGPSAAQLALNYGLREFERFDGWKEFTR